MSATQPLAYLNGQFLPQVSAHLPLHDAGFVWGATVTDLCRTFHQRLYRLADHLHRFRHSCRLARVPQTLSDEELTGIAERLVEHNAALLGAGQELALVLFATPGPIGYYAGLPSGPGSGAPTLGLHTFPLPFARYARLFREGGTLIVPAVRQVPAACLDRGIKHRSRLHWWLAEQEVHEIDPSASALLLDEQGRVTETAAANLLIVRGGTVLSPRRESILPGVSLRVVEELCAELAIPFAEADLTLEDCQQADEVMLSNTAFCLAGVRRLQGVELPWPGAVFERLLRAWGEMVGVDIRAQVCEECRG
jgi:branched-subunit amino acid aminotransferase/4-amino-4-deoxychorismate lyase